MSALIQHKKLFTLAQLMNNNLTRTIVLNKDHMEFINDTQIETIETLDIYDVFIFPSRIPKYSKHIGLNSPLSDVAEFIKSLFIF